MPPAPTDPAATFVVVAAFNEAPVIREVVTRLGSAFRNVVVVDDGSRDGTSEQLDGLGVTVLRHAINLGQGASLQTGITWALSRGARIVVTFDADGQHRVEDAQRLVRELERGDADAVLGSRFLGQAVNIPWSRRLVLKVAITMARWTRKVRLTDVHNGLRALGRNAAATLDIQQAGMAHASEIVDQLVRRGMMIREVPVTIEYTPYSLGKGQRVANMVNIVIDLFLRRFER
jgi:glycosyltransferase involved in cell wall biosynthesis